MKIYLAADHAGFELKEKLKPFLEDLGHTVEDFGAHKYNETDDYPDFMMPAAKAISEDESAESRGILLGGSGQGEAMAANRFSGARAAAYYGGNTEILKLSREHNDANILSLAARFISEEDAKEAMQTWLETPFSGDERHTRRIQKLDSHNA